MIKILKKSSLSPLFTMFLRIVYNVNYLYIRNFYVYFIHILFYNYTYKIHKQLVKGEIYEQNKKNSYF